MQMEEITARLMQECKDGIIMYCKHVVPNSKPVIGVKVPKLRQMAKQIAKEDYRTFMEQYPEDYFEQQMLKAYVIGYAKDDITTILHYADIFLPSIQDWAVNDAFCSTFTIARKYEKEVWNWLIKYAECDDEFLQRVVAVMMMSQFLTKEYVQSILDTMNLLKNPGYYTKMGIAWCVATAYAKFPTETLAFLKANELDDWTYNKSIQKMKESFRVSEEDKELLTSMKR